MTETTLSQIAAGKKLVASESFMSKKKNGKLPTAMQMLNQIVNVKFSFFKAILMSFYYIIYIFFYYISIHSSLHFDYLYFYFCKNSHLY